MVVRLINEHHQTHLEAHIMKSKLRDENCDRGNQTISLRITSSKIAKAEICMREAQADVALLTARVLQQATFAGKKWRQQTGPPGKRVRKGQRERSSWKDSHPQRSLCELADHGCAPLPVVARVEPRSHRLAISACSR